MNIKIDALTAVQNALQSAIIAEATSINVLDAAALPGKPMDWHEFGIDVVLIEERNRVNADVVAYRCYSPQIDDDWVIGTVENAIEALDTYVSHLITDVVPDVEDHLFWESQFQVD